MYNELPYLIGEIVLNCRLIGNRDKEDSLPHFLSLCYTLQTKQELVPREENVDAISECFFVKYGRYDVGLLAQISVGVRCFGGVVGRDHYLWGGWLAMGRLIRIIFRYIEFAVPF